MRTAGGLLDSVRPGVTGTLIPPRDVAALRPAIIDLLQDPARRDAMAANCSHIAVSEYSSALLARRYIALYEEMLAGAQRIPKRAQHLCL